MSELELLVGAGAFWRRASADCAMARERLWVQAMTFEGDEAGQSVARAIAASGAADRRVLVDAYTRVVMSDRWVAWPKALLPTNLRDERNATWAMFRGLTAEGVRVRVTNPLHPLMTNYPARNHKKLIVADDVAYLGGINFSDHNFAWRDFMIRLEGAEIAEFLAADFQATWSGKPRARSLALDGLSLLSLDGRSNDGFFRQITELLDAARQEIVVMSAYLTFPFTAPLAAAARRGVKITLITPWANNKPLVRDYLLEFARRNGFHIHLLSEMSHLKGLLVDGERLIVGSCNFDFVGLAAEEELVAVIEQPALIEDFRRRVIDPALGQTPAPGRRNASLLTGHLAHGVLRLGQLGAKLARGARRTAVDWRN
ncbi:MAG TPA: phosphatidylserine/phosphatidylglycerophosphate/cardiolipin synthase family protein [Caulobacteraceae bacterium]